MKVSGQLYGPTTLFLTEESPVLIAEEAEWDPELFWTDMKGEKCHVHAWFGPRLFSFPTKNLCAMPAATIVADQNLAVEMSRRCGYQGQLRLSCTLRWIFESQMRAGGYLLQRNYLLGFVLLLLLCIRCQNKQSCWRIKAKSAVQHIGLKTLCFERETSRGGGSGFI